MEIHGDGSATPGPTATPAPTAGPARLEPGVTTSLQAGDVCFSDAFPLNRDHLRLHTPLTFILFQKKRIPQGTDYRVIVE